MSRRGSTRAIAAAHAAGVELAVHECEPSPGESAPGHHRRPAWGVEAAAALGVDPRRVFKTLVATVDGGGWSLGSCRWRASLTCGPSPPPSMAAGRRWPLPAVLDTSARDWPTIHVSAGRRGLQLEIDPADLVRLTGAIITPIARES